MKQELILFTSAMLPLTELRGTIPLGILIYKANPITVYFLAIIGNLVPVILLQLLLPKLVNFISQYNQWLKTKLDHYFIKVHTKHAHKLQKYGAIFLILFVAIPLPGSGGWTGSLLAYLTGYSKKKGILFVSIGVILSGIIMTILSLSPHLFDL